MIRQKGLYYGRLSRTFITLGILLSLALAAIILLIFIHTEESRTHAETLIVEAQKNMETSVISFAEQSMNSLLVSDSLYSWISAEEGDENYYRSAIVVFEELQKQTPFSQTVSYDIAVTTPSPSSFVITKDGTRDKPYYFFNESGVEDKDFQALKDGVYPLSDFSLFRFVVNRKILDQYVIFIISIPSSSLFLPSDGHWEISDTARGITFYNGIDKAFSDDDRLQYTSYPIFSLLIAHQYDIDAYSFAYILISVIPCLFILLIFLFLKMAKRLYRPVEEAWSSLEDKDLADKDEFAVIVDKCRNIAKLSEELENVMTEQFFLEEQQKYRAFINNTPVEVSDSDSACFFTLAVVFSPLGNVKNNIVFSKLDMKTKETPHLHFIRTLENEATVIFKCADAAHCGVFLRNKIEEFISFFKESVDWRIAISDTVHGCYDVHNAYKQASLLLSYRYKFSSAAIITSSDVDLSQPFFDYPFSMERKLIMAALADEDDALRIFDEIVEANTVSQEIVSDGEYKRFTYALTTSVLRIFQELKTTESELIGERIDWSELYTNENSVQTIRQLRSIIEKILFSRKQQEEIASDKIIDKMKAFISGHYNENIMLIDLANEFNLTPKYCSSIFKKLGNDSFKNYLNQYRINVAIRLLEENPSIKISELGENVGFMSSATFIKVFTRYVGTTPGAFAQRIAFEKK